MTTELPTTFDYWGTTLDGYCSMYNLTWYNERWVEIAVAAHWLAHNGTGGGLEVGNVMGHYWPTEHDIVDKYEKAAFHQSAEDVHNTDLFDVRGRFDWIVSISTIEHIGVDYPSERSGLDALAHLRAQLAPNGRMLVTFPTGFNATLDEAVLAQSTGATRSAVWLKLGPQEWWQSPEPKIAPYRLVDDWAAGVWIGEFES